MSGRRVRGFLTVAAFLALGWWIHVKRPTVSGLVDALTRPLLGSRAAVKASERKRVVREASQVLSVGEEKTVGALHEGMSPWEVRGLLGDPDQIQPIEDEKGDSVRWIYREQRRVLVFQRNRVVSIAIR